MIMSMFFTTQACLFQVVTICIQWRSASSETAEDESRWFRPPKTVQEEDSLFVQSNFKSTQYKDRTWQAACEQKFCIFDPGSVFKDYKAIPIKCFVSHRPPSREGGSRRSVGQKKKKKN